MFGMVFRRTLLATLLVALLTAQSKCYPPPAAGATASHSATVEAQPNDGNPCKTRKYAFVITESGVNCTGFNFNAQLTEAQTLRNAVVCTDTTCTVRASRDLRLLTTCTASVGKTRLESEITCSSGPITTNTAGLTLPTPPITETDIIYDPTLSTPSDQVFQVPTNTAAVACDEYVQVVYREKVETCTGVNPNSPRFKRRGREAAARYLTTLTCAAGCTRAAEPIIVQQTGTCNATTNMVEMVTWFVACPK
jgi:hypothetical protein